MTAYLVSYDLDKPGQDYHRLIGELERLKAKRVLYSEWIFNSTSSAAQIRDHLRGFTDANDMLLVLTLTGEAAWTQLMITDQATKQALSA
jgi:hypothetical protein